MFAAVTKSMLDCGLAALPDLAQSLTDNGGQRPGSSAAPGTCSGFPPGKPPAFPQVCGMLYIKVSPSMLLQLGLPHPSATVAACHITSSVPCLPSDLPRVSQIVVGIIDWISSLFMR